MSLRPSFSQPQVMTLRTSRSILESSQYPSHGPGSQADLGVNGSPSTQLALQQEDSS